MSEPDPEDVIYDLRPEGATRHMEAYPVGTIAALTAELAERTHEAQMLAAMVSHLREAIGPPVTDQSRLFAALVELDEAKQEIERRRMAAIAAHDEHHAEMEALHERAGRAVAERDERIAGLEQRLDRQITNGGFTTGHQAGFEVGFQQGARRQRELVAGVLVAKIRSLSQGKPMDHRMFLHPEDRFAIDVLEEYLNHDGTLDTEVIPCAEAEPVSDAYKLGTKAEGGEG